MTGTHAKHDTTSERVNRWRTELTPRQRKIGFFSTVLVALVVVGLVSDRFIPGIWSTPAAWRDLGIEAAFVALVLVVGYWLERWGWFRKLVS